MKKVTSTTALVAMILSFATTAFAFSDTAGHKYEDDIKFISDGGIVQGYDDGTYKPDALINRAEFTKIIIGAKLSGAPMPDASKCFKDIKDEWFAIYVCYAKDQGIIQGYDDGNFRPNNNISIAEASKIIIGGLMGSKITDTVGVEWYVPFMEKLSYYNAIPATLKYMPADTEITRGEMAFMIATLLQKDSTTENPTDDEVVDIPSEVFAEKNVYGEMEADISILVFTDFECPFCKTYHESLQKVVDESNSTVNFEYKNFPLYTHENAYFEAATGECLAQVGDNDQYWKFIDSLFAGSYADVYEIEVPVIATGADIIEFYDCVAEEDSWNQVDQDYALGESIGVVGTPSSIIRNNTTGEVLTFQGTMTETELNDVITQLQDIE